ncbi:DUF2459 domain-containing protein [Methylocaldum szegediense]|jgi:uncharacterized protein (TIGR02117 family)|uniref:DUF2459 domain-containing protein n=1 Tax=Methylocaldum szegediense TaxID=73780 RepID=A0ABM9I029_9GAMM|nr:DUF2459 domain-containing protein [Methylocaldum szegediense]CAI8801079.1 conserved protein of unknown function [Methylocaldum szegediense]
MLDNSGQSRKKHRKTATPPATLWWLLAALILFAGCATNQVHQALPFTYPDRTIYLVDLGWHTGLAVKRADIPPGLWPEAQDFPKAEYLEVGWGDHDFYQSAGFNLWYGIKALLVPTRSVLHVVGVPVHPTAYFSAADIVEIQLSERQLRQVIVSIHNTYSRTNTDRVQAIAPGLYPDSRFYPAEGKFHMFNTCNVWVARILRDAGLPVVPFFAVSSRGLLSQALEFGKIVRPEAEDH